ECGGGVVPRDHEIERRRAAAAGGVLRLGAHHGRFDAVLLQPISCALQIGKGSAQHHRNVCTVEQRRLASGLAAAAAHRVIVILTIFTGSRGRSFGSVRTFSIFCTTSMPSMTLPKTGCLDAP